MPDDELLPFLRLNVQMPPRHGKSELISKHYNAWYLGTFPTHHIILTSYEANFARSWGRKAREVLEATGEEAFGVRVSRTTSAANDWELAGDGGGMITAGIGGAITGRGANVLVIDDPVKNAEQAASEVIQARNYDWYLSTAYTRLETDENGLEGIVLLVQTRWHERDLAGRVLSDEEALDDGEVWYVLDLPAVAVQGDILGRPIGAALWPERYPIRLLDRIRRRIGTYWWSALYQQRPSPEQGNLFKRGWWQYYDTLPEGQHFGYISVDTAGFEDGGDGDYAVLAPVVRAAKDLYWLREFRRGRWAFPELVQKCLDLHDITGLPFLIEETPWAKPLIQTLKARVGSVVTFKTGGQSKTVRASRAMAITPYAESAQFFLPRNAPWVADFIEEHAQFPKGAHDDQVDTTSQVAIRLLVERRGAIGPPARVTPTRYRRGGGGAVEYGGRA